MRIELFFKSAAQLSTCLELYREQSMRDPTLYKSFNLPNKMRDENLSPYAEQVLGVFPSSDVSVHYSLKNNKFKTMDESVTHFKKTIQKAEEIGVKELLLVSGSGDKRKINSSSCLTQLCRENFVCNLNIGVAFNPYFFTDREMDIEKNRLKEKLDSGLVSTVYLQFGSELNLLRQSAQYLQNELLPSYPNKRINIVGSIFLPSKQLINRMKFRPWKGLYLSPEFLNSVEEADSIVKQMILLYREYNIEPIIETAVKTEKEIEYMKQLLTYSGETVQKDSSVSV